MSSKSLKVLAVFGTRPEAIKMCPLVRRLEAEPDIDIKVCVTGQHREMLQQALDVFGVVPEYDLQLMKESQSLSSLTAAIISGMENVISDANPSLVLVHGDTTTAMASAIASFYHQIPIGHVEAGLRSNNIASPFPEEMNRRLVSNLSTLHFAPTEGNRQSLAKEGIFEHVYVTGNTVIDSFAYTVHSDYTFSNRSLACHDFNMRTVLVTAHRRENIGEPLADICMAIKEIASRHKDIAFIYPVHLNPTVRKTVFAILDDTERVVLLDPVDVVDMHNAIARSWLVLTDSGGLQEEAPHFGKPVLVARRETERPEAVASGTVRVVGINRLQIIEAIEALIEDEKLYSQMSVAVNPYGDGHASERITSIVEEWHKSSSV